MRDEVHRDRAARQGLWWRSALLSLMIVLAGCGRDDAPTAPAQPAAPAESATPAPSTDSEDVAPEQPTAEAAARRDEVAPPAELPQPEPARQRAIVAFVMGDAFLVDDARQTPLEPGQQIEPGATVSVAGDSYVEIQFDANTVVRIDEDSTARLASLIDTPTSTRTSMQLVRGSLNAAVTGLARGSAFEVQTTTAQLGVRGTEFRVIASDEDATTLAVREGNVYYIPIGHDPVDLLAGFDTEPPPRLVLALERLVADAPQLPAGRQITISRSDAAASEALAATLREQVETIARAPQAATFGQYDDLETTIDRLLEGGQTLTDNVRDVTPATRRELDEFETITPVAVDPQTGLPDAGELRISTEPANATIFIDGEPRGVSELSGLFDAGRPITVGVEAPGFAPFEREVVPRSGRPIELNVRLERPRQGVRIETRPANAEIVVNGVAAGRGSAAIAFEDGTELDVLVSAPGYNPERRSVVVRTGRELRLEVVLEESVVDRYRAGAGSLIDEIVATPSGFVVVDEFGSAAAVGRDGNRLWIADTANTPLTRGAPVVSGNRLYLSGPTEFVVVNAVDGTVIHRETLPRERAHLFGTRVVPLDDRLVFPIDGALRVYTRDGTFRTEFALPGRSLATPAPLGDTVVTALQDGSVILVDPADGTVRRTIPTGLGQVVAVRPVVRSGVAYLAGNGGTVAAVDVAAGRVAWEQRPAAIAITHDLAVDATGVYGFGQGRLVALSTATGTPLFDTVTGVAAPPLLHEGLLYIPMSDRTLSVRAGRSGREIVRIDLGDLPTTRPALVDDTVAVGTDGGTVILLRPVDPALAR